MSGVEIVLAGQSLLASRGLWVGAFFLFALGLVLAWDSWPSRRWNHRFRNHLILAVIMPVGLITFAAVLSNVVPDMMDVDATQSAVEDHYGVTVPDLQMPADGGVLDVHIEAPNGDLGFGAVRRDGGTLFLYRSVDGALELVDPADAGRSELYDLADIDRVWIET